MIKGFILKLSTIIVWCVILTSFLWLFWPLSESSSNFDKWIYAFISVMFGNAGFTFISGLYKTSIREFDAKHLISGMAIIITTCAAIFFTFGAAFNSIRGNTVAELVSITFAIIFVLLFIIFGPLGVANDET